MAIFVLGRLKSRGHKGEGGAWICPPGRVMSLAPLLASAPAVSFGSFVSVRCFAVSSWLLPPGLDFRVFDSDIASYSMSSPFG